MKAKEWDIVAKDYLSNLSSPFEKGVKNPLFSFLKNLKNKKKLNVVDLGTGVGNLLPYIEGKFRKIVAIDFSQKMLEIAKKRSKSGKIRFFKEDMRNLSGFYNKFDIAFSINSILMPAVSDIKKIISETYKVLKKKGVLVAVFPALESVLYKAMLTYESEIKRKKKKQAIKRTHKLIESKKYDFLTGFMEEEGEQKHFYRFELLYRLSEAGFKNIQIKRVEYPWRIWEEKYFLRFRKKPGMWDWFVVAEK